MCYASACLQVASLFDLLEMARPSHTPDDGTGIDEWGRTHSPARTFETRIEQAPRRCASR